MPQMKERKILYLVNMVGETILLLSFLLLCFLPSEKDDMNNHGFYSSSCISLGGTKDEDEVKIISLFDDQYFQKVYSTSKLGEAENSENFGAKTISSNTTFSFSQREKQKMLSISFSYSSAIVCSKIIVLETDEAVMKIQKEFPLLKENITGYIYEGNQVYQNLNTTGIFISLCSFMLLFSFSGLFFGRGNR